MRAAVHRARLVQVGSRDVRPGGATRPCFAQRIIPKLDVSRVVNDAAPRPSPSSAISSRSRRCSGPGGSRPQSSKSTASRPRGSASASRNDHRRAPMPDRRTGAGRADRAPNDCRGMLYDPERRRARICPHLLDFRSSGFVWPRSSRRAPASGTAVGRGRAACDNRHLRSWPAGVLGCGVSVPSVSDPARELVKHGGNRNRYPA